MSRKDKILKEAQDAVDTFGRRVARVNNGSPLPAESINDDERDGAIVALTLLVKEQQKQIAALWGDFEKHHHYSGLE